MITYTLENDLELIPFYDVYNYHVGSGISKANYLSWFSDEEVIKYSTHGRKLYTVKDADTYVESLRNRDDYFVWALVVGNVHIGNISLTTDKNNFSGELGFLLGEKEYWNKGYATQAGRKITEFAFKKLNLHKIWLGTAVENEGMRQVALYIGMIGEGVLKDHLFVDGKFQDCAIYGKINDTK